MSPKQRAKHIDADDFFDSVVGPKTRKNLNNFVDPLTPQRLNQLLRATADACNAIAAAPFELGDKQAFAKIQLQCTSAFVRCDVTAAQTWLRRRYALMTKLCVKYAHRPEFAN
jgi:hypothetical protein